MDAINPSKLNRINHTGAKIKMEKFEDKLVNMIDTVKTRAEREVCEYGHFREVKEIIKNTDSKSLVKDLTLQITPLSEPAKKAKQNALSSNAEQKMRL